MKLVIVWIIWDGNCEDFVMICWVLYGSFEFLVGSWKFVMDHVFL
jgi:hypothetical protein